MRSREPQSRSHTKADELASHPNMQKGKHFPDNNKYQGRLGLHSPEVMIDHILYVFKHQHWVRLPKPSKHDSDLLEAGGHCSFHGSRGHVTLHCLTLKGTSRIWFNMVPRRVHPQLGEDSKVGGIPAKSLN